MRGFGKVDIPNNLMISVHTSSMSYYQNVLRKYRFKYFMYFENYFRGRKKLSEKSYVCIMNNNSSGKQIKYNFSTHGLENSFEKI